MNLIDYNKPEFKILKHLNFIFICLIQITIIFGIHSCGTNVSKSSVVGTWEGKSDSLLFRFYFKQNGICEISFKNISNGEQKNFTGKFEIGKQKKPSTITIKNIAKLRHSLYSIIKFVNKDSIIIADFSNRWRLRPISFNSESDIQLKRAK